MSHTMSPPLALSGGRLELVPIDERRWRLCDGNVPHSDAAHVVAYVEKTDDGLDVVWLLAGGLPTKFARFDQILTIAQRLVRLGDSRGSTRPVPIPHRSPAPH